MKINRKTVFFSLIWLTTVLGISAQEPKASYFDDFVFKNPWEYKTGYNNDTHRLLKVFDMGGYTALEIEQEFSVWSDGSVSVYVLPVEFLFDPITKKRYHLVWTMGIPKFKGEKYLEGSGHDSYTRKKINYTLFFNRVPKDVKSVNFIHAADWDDMNKFWGSDLFYDISMTKRTEVDKDYIQWVNIDPKASWVHYYTPLSITKFKEDDSGKGTLNISLAYRHMDNDSKHTSFSFWLNNNFTLIDPVSKRKYPSANIKGFPTGEKKNFKGFDIIAFSCNFNNVNSDVNVVDVYEGDKCIIKGLKIKPEN